MRDCSEYKASKFPFSSKAGYPHRTRYIPFSAINLLQNRYEDQQYEIFQKRPRTHLYYNCQLSDKHLSKRKNISSFCKFLNLIWILMNRLEGTSNCDFFSFTKSSPFHAQLSDWLLSVLAVLGHIQTQYCPVPRAILYQTRLFHYYSIFFQPALSHLCLQKKAKLCSWQVNRSNIDFIDKNSRQSQKLQKVSSQAWQDFAFPYNICRFVWRAWKLIIEVYYMKSLTASYQLSCFAHAHTHALSCTRSIHPITFRFDTLLNSCIDEGKEE